MNKMYQKLVFGALVLALVFSFSFAAAAGSASVTFNLKADLKKVESDGLVIDITKISVPFSFFFMGEKKELANELKAIPTPLVNFKVDKNIISKIRAQGHSDNPILNALGAKINFSEVTMADEIKDIRGKYHSDKSFSDILFWLKRDSQKFEISDGYVSRIMNTDITIYSSGVKNVNCWKDGILTAFNQARFNSSKIKKVIRNFKSAKFSDIKEDDKIKKIVGQCFKDGSYEISEFNVLDKSLPDNYCRGKDKTREDCGSIRSWSCVNNQCQKARCGDGVCNDDGFSPAAESASCSYDCGGSSDDSGSGNDGNGDNGSGDNSDSGSEENIVIPDDEIPLVESGYQEKDVHCSAGVPVYYKFIGCISDEQHPIQIIGTPYASTGGKRCVALRRNSPPTADEIQGVFDYFDNTSDYNRQHGIVPSDWLNFSGLITLPSGTLVKCNIEGYTGIMLEDRKPTPKKSVWYVAFYSPEDTTLGHISISCLTKLSDCASTASDIGSGCSSASDCGGSSQWSCVNGQCQAAKCGDGFCNDCNDNFSPCVPSETSENCSQDCKEKTIKQNAKDYSTKGYTIGYKAFWNIDESNKDQGIDYCTTIKDGSVGSHKVSAGPYLVEFYKDDLGFAAFEVVKCENGCKDGACLSN